MSPRGGVDLHLHSTASDGAFSPADVAQRALTAGLRVVALSDHDTTEGLSDFKAAADSLRVIPAVELTCRIREGPLGTVHVLGYRIDPAASLLEDVTRRNRQGKREQVRGILERLSADEGIAIGWDDVAGRQGADAYVGRQHVAGVMIQRGITKNRQRAFRRYLRSERVPLLEAVTAEEALQAIHEAGGVSVLAHPTEEDISRHVRPLVGLGLLGIEVFRPRAPEHRQARLLGLAERHGLFVTGGSDWHGHYPEGPLGDWQPPLAPLQPFLERIGQ